MVKLTDESSKEAFIDYCRKFIQSMTILFLPSETFVADEDHPSVILLDRNDEVIGAASLILEGRYRSLRKGRFMILHSRASMTDAYRSPYTITKKNFWNRRGLSLCFIRKTNRIHSKGNRFQS